MNISNVRRVLNGGHPELHLTIDGVPATISLEQKRTLLDRGFVSLHPKGVWARRLEPLHVEDKAEGIGPTPLPGFTDDPEILALTRAAIADCDAGVFLSA